MQGMVSGVLLVLAFTVVAAAAVFAAARLYRLGRPARKTERPDG
jgi:hypothetical protein